MSCTRMAFAMLFGAVIAGTQSNACSTSHTVVPGDTLSAIASVKLGSVFAFERIHDFNRDVIGENPHLLEVGQELRIPCGSVELGDIDWSVMPNPDALAQMLGQTEIQILDIRKAKNVAKGVIPGSISVPYGNWRGPKGNSGQPPTPEKVAAIIGDAGLHLNRPIIIVHDRDHPMQTGAAAVVYWILKSSGAGQIAILRGGYKGWHSAGLPIAEAPTRPAPYVSDTPYAFWNWRADEVTVYGIATGQTPGHLLDARPHGMFEKVDSLGKALATTLPGAQNLPAPPIMAALAGEVNIEDGVQTVIEAFQEIGVTDAGDPVVTFCHVGELGALNWFYASELAGLPGIRLYPQSLKGWTTAGGLLFEGKS